MHKTSLILLLVMGTAATAQAKQTVDETRLNAVAQRGSKVMPFNLDKTLHIFNKTKNGGLQQVIAKDANDTEQINLIRKHLAEIANKFKHGDFSGPVQIHGSNMPGLVELKTHANQLHIVYREIAQGGEIEYMTSNPQLITAIHRFFAAQISDHGRHATSGKHAQHHMLQPQ